MSKKQKEDAKPGETPMEFVGSMAVVLVTGLFIITFIFQAFEIPSSSMEDTLLIGDHVFVDRLAYAPRTGWVGPVLPYRDLQRGDIVVFLSPAESGLYVVKRVIGLPGDRLHLRDGVVFLNGVPQDESYVIRRGDYRPYRDDFPAVSMPSGATTPEWYLSLPSHLEGGDLVVPEDNYFMMGDNRDASYDSRFWGFVPREHVIGRPMIIYWSFETPPGQYLKTAPSERLSYLFHVVIHFFDQTRWRRTFHLVR